MSQWRDSMDSTFQRKQRCPLYCGQFSLTGGGCGETLTAVLDSLAEQDTEGVNDAGGGRAVHTSAQRQQETSLDTNEQRR